MSRSTNTKKLKTDEIKSMDTDDASKCFASNNQQLVRFFTGKYEGKMGYVDTTRRISATGKVPVIIQLKNGVLKKTAVSIWSYAKPHPLKPSNFAEAAVMQKPTFEKELKLFAKKCVQIGFTKNDNRLNSLIEIFYEEIETAKAKNKQIAAGAVQYDD